MAENKYETICGYVAIVGRPNVGKSSLLNQILTKKLSITSRKPQTTRHRILGVKTRNLVQTIYLDTPGIHFKEKHALNRYMNQVARRAMHDVDVVVFMIEALKWTDEDEYVFERVAKLNCPVILVVNKVDTVPDKSILLPYLQKLSARMNFLEIIPLSVKRKTNINQLEEVIARALPKSPHYFPETDLTDRTPRFRISELIREKVVRAFGAELPYTTSIEIEKFELNDEKKMAFIEAVIWVEREGQKPILIGKSGERLKEIGIRARLDIQTMLKQKVHLKLWVKVREGWSDDERALKSLGYLDLE